MAAWAARTSTVSVDGAILLRCWRPQGYAVLEPNYRGSGGYGSEFERDIMGHFFNNSHLDVMAGADHVIEMGIADSDRMVVRGWSSGGYLTNKIITFTDRFKAASSGASAVNWISFYSQSDLRFFAPRTSEAPRGRRDAPADFYWEQSPLSQIANVTTPTLVLVGEEGCAGASSSVGRAVSSAQVQRRSDAPLHGPSRRTRMERAAPSTVQDERGVGLVREIRDGPRLYMGKGARRNQG